MWVRGLKLHYHHNRKNNDQSHPMWVRGLKLLTVNRTLTDILVAPYVGAWIETSHPQKEGQCQDWSHPMWVRGLKPNPFY